MIRPLLLITLSLLLILTAVPGARLSAAETTPVTLPLARSIQPLLSAHPGKTGLYVLEKGEESLLARAWLADHATKSIDVQYFIWSSDNIGILASEALLRAAERGIRVRVLVDDLLIDAPPESLLALARHPNIDIRIYNPKMTVGTSKVKRFANVVTGFRSVNQRMHDKTALFDGMVGITGGRNMADEYYDFDQEYTFRDRDMLMLGPTVAEAEASFARFWESPLAVPVEKLLKKPMKKMTPERTGQVYAGLHAYAGKPENFAPEVRQALQNLPRRFDGLLREMVWDEARFISDLPGKNSGREGLGGGGRSTAALVDAVSRAKRRVTIQSPYLVMPEGGVELFRKLIRRGVEVRIVTNSLAATDNLQAFSGYRKQRNRLLKAGITIREFRPDPAVRQELIDRYPKLKEKPPHLRPPCKDHGDRRRDSVRRHLQPGPPFRQPEHRGGGDGPQPRPGPPGGGADRAGHAPGEQLESGHGQPGPPRLGGQAEQAAPLEVAAADPHPLKIPGM